MKIKTIKPDYRLWSKYDRWTLIEGALLLNELNPFHYRDHRFTVKESPEDPTLQKAYESFLIFKNSNWPTTSDFLNRRDSHSPSDFINMALRKNLPIPQELEEQLSQLYDVNYNNPHTLNRSVVSDSYDEYPSEREKNNTRKILALLMDMFVLGGHDGSDFIYATSRINFSALGNAIKDYAAEKNIPTDGLNSANKKLSDIYEEFKENYLPQNKNGKPTVLDF